MDSWIVNILIEIFRSIPWMVRNPSFVVVSLIALFLVYRQYLAIATQKRRMFGLVHGDPKWQTLKALGYGVVGGLLASFLFVLLGISVSHAGIIYVWPLALLLMLIYPRFLCFSYGGGIVAAASLLVGWPQVDVPSLMALIAVLHVVEAVLIYFTGSQDPMPVYVRKEEGQVVGGFILQKFWPLPFIGLFSAFISSELAGELAPMPQWWPLIQPAIEVPADSIMVYVPWLIVAAVGYGDIVLSNQPKNKTRVSSFSLLFFGVTLLVMAVLGSRWPIWQYVATVFAPVGHDLVIFLGRRREEERKAVFTNEAGPMVLDVLPDSIAQMAGLATGDIVKSANKVPVEDWYQIHETTMYADVELEVENFFDGTRKTLILPHSQSPIGVIPAPHPNSRFNVDYAAGQTPGKLGRFFGRLWRRLFSTR
ncbi:MAG: PDZ domain-containing protein [Limnochordia bacterium]|jgi:hypothetical protein